MKGTAASCEDSEVKRVQELLHAHFVMAGDALQYAGQCLCPDGIVEGYHFVVLTIDLRGVILT